MDPDDSDSVWVLIRLQEPTAPPVVQTHNNPMPVRYVCGNTHVLSPTAFNTHKQSLISSPL